jgi:hypothetical protein
MKNQLHISLLLLFLNISSVVFATHIVGGTLTYVYNGGSSYTVTLKLYRDCSAGTASFPASVDINVLGYNGATFVPSKDITISLGAVTSVPPTLDPCAVPPNPMPCVQEGIYSKTVNNLPPNPGGYHLTYQIVARNLSLTNVNSGCSCVGESFYAYIPGQSVIWGEDFTLPDNTTVDNGTTAWSRTLGGIAPNSAKIQNNLFEIAGANNAQVTWTSQVIPISSCPSVNVKVDLTQGGNCETSDSLRVYYKLNGGPLTLFPTSGSNVGNFSSAVASASGLSGSTLQIVIRAHYSSSSPSSEIFQFDNVLVFCNDFAPNNDPVFSHFPPIFVCAGSPFSFDHSATDANGDSLSYSFYTPYDGDNAIGGPLDPTFSNNIAQFTPIVFKPGYSATNPLGGSPLNINPTTGLLSGTPTAIGQYVVGIVVKEWRNGVLIGQTLRDFQFNVVNCPQPAPPYAGPDVTVNQGCNQQLGAAGFTPASITWKSVYPGALGAYNNYLSCTSGCLNPTVTQLVGAPPYVDYQICGIASSCNHINTCDTVRVFFKPPLVVSIAPANPTLCVGQTSVTLTASGGGGTPPYTYLWNNINPAQSITVGTGTYTVKLSDVTGCPPAFSTVTVTSFTVAITVNAGSDKTICKQNPTTTLNGSVTGALGGIWSGGAGAFSPTNTTLSGVTYTPTAAELAAGFAKLILTSTGNGICPAISDTMKINYQGFNGTVAIAPTPVSCFGGNDGTAMASVTGGAGLYTYSWNTVPAQSTALATNLTVGTYSVTVTNAIGCTSAASTTITQPSALAVNSVITNVSCPGGNNGSIAVTPTGGVAPYTYVWQPGNQTTSFINNQIAGSYSVTVTDSKNCKTIPSYSITQPAVIGISFVATPVNCFNGSTGIANSSITGGTPPYTYNWSSGASSPNATALHAGTYTLTITDKFGCTASNSVVINQPPALIANVTSSNITCNNLSNGTASATVSGGTPTYTYLWQPGALTNQNINGLSNGTYTLTATDFNTCTTTAFATITKPLPLTIGFVNQVNVSCFGRTDGAVTASPAGGTQNYNYSWMPGGATTATISNLAIGTYTVTVTDANGCNATNSVTISQLPFLSASSTSTNETCSYLNNGSATASASGGTAGYTYLWQPNLQTTSSISNLSSGTYTLTVTDAKGCTATTQAIITEPAMLSINVTSQNNISCSGGNNGSATVSGSGGTPAYAYLWTSLAATTSVVTNLSAGNYPIKVTDSHGCTAVNSITITQPPLFAVSTTSTNETCNYLNNGTVTAVPSGGTAGYTYLWQPGGLTSGTITNLSAGIYSLTVTDSKACTATATATITEPPTLLVSFTNQVNASCLGKNDGTVTASPTGGTQNYSYAWMPGGATTATISNLSVGTYTVTVTDAKGCITTNSVTITQLPLLSVSNTSTNETCSYLNNGSAAATVTGGTAGYTYLWQPNLQTTSSISNLSAGTYSLTVTDVKGCTATTQAVITEPAVLAVTFTSQNNVSCSGGNNGTATASPTGGTPAYSYLWTSLAATTSVVTNLSAGTYPVKVTDSLGCFVNGSLVITQSPPLFASATSTNETCNYLNNGTATAVPSGGTSGYTYVWQPGGLTTGTISNLSAGTYSLTVTDSKACTATATATITEPPTLLVSFTNQVNASCIGKNDGTVTTSPTGGTQNYSYVWMPGGATTATISNLSAGTYTVTITDAKGCTTTNSVIITQPLLLSLSAVSINETCSYLNNGSATATATGGTAGYTYLWQPNLQTTGSVSNLSAGTYTLTVTDIKGCTANTQAVITEPVVLAVTFTSQNNVSCSGGNNGTATASPTGGTPAYSYLWTSLAATTSVVTNLSAGTYPVKVTDSLGCFVNGSLVITQSPPLFASATSTNETCNYLNNGTATAVPSGGTSGYTYVWQPGGLTTGTISNLSAGTYSLTIADSKACTATATATITEPPTLSVSFTNQVNVSCSGKSDGSVMASVTGGTQNYSYVWMPGGATTATISNLSALTYTVTITDAKGCTATNSVTITQPLLLSVSAVSTNETCSYLNNGLATATAVGGTAGYTYLWQPNLQTTNSVSNLSAGTYSLTVTDIKGCTATTQAVITEPAVLAVTFTSQNNVSCSGGNNGSATASPTGGTPAYTYLWTSLAATASVVTNLSAGTYPVKVTDSQGCFVNGSLVITQSPPLFASATSTNETCNYLNNGTATAVPSGGTAGYTYVWQPGGLTTGTISNLSAGTYSLTVTDSMACTASTTAVITEPSTLSVSFTSQVSVSCSGRSDGAVTASVTGGTQNYSYAWMPGGATTASILNVPIGTYTVTVTDAKGCTTTNSISIVESTPLSVSVSSLPATCYGKSDGSVSAIASGGSGVYSYNWMPVNTVGATVANLAADTYTVTVTDSKGCAINNSVVVNQPTEIVLVASSQNSDCGHANGQTSVAASGGSAPYTYLWLPTGGNNDTAVGLLSGAYTVKVTDSVGCTASQFGNVNENTAPVLTIFSVINVTCFGGSNGSATVGTSGGTGPFTYTWLPFGGADSVANDLTAGTYTVTVVDANGCQSLATTSPAIMQPTAIQIVVTKNNASCFGGSDGNASAVATGGMPGYSYKWLPSLTLGNNVSGLSANSYAIEVTDANSCLKTKLFTIAQPAALSVPLSSTPANCFGSSTGSVSGLASGGTGPYNYNWMPGNINGPTISNLPLDTYTVTVVDSKGCIDSNTVNVTQPTAITLVTDSINSNCSLANGQASVTASGGVGSYLYNWSPSGGTNATAIALISGGYTISVKDGNNCVAAANVIVNDNKSPTVIVSSVTNVSCNGGSNGTATATVTGGTGPYVYSWSPSGGTDSVATGLLPGTYTVTVTDVHACQSNSAISPVITQPSPILISLTTTDVDCFGNGNGAASAIISGGTAGYSYQWLPGGTNSTSVSNLAPNSYTVQVTDTNHCVQAKPFTITQPAVLSASVSAIPATCFGTSSGSVSAVAAGGTGPYNYNWMPGNSNGASISNLPINTYTITVTDSKGCSITNNATVTQPTAIVLVTDSTNSNCGAANGQATVVASGGVGGYLYDWLPTGGTNAAATALFSGIYTISVTDGNNCVANKNVKVNNNGNPIVIVSSITNISCYGSSDGTAKASVTGGQGPYTFSWLPSGGTDSVAVGLSPGTYTVTVTDVHACQSNSAVSPVITQPSPILISLTTTNVDCFGNGNGAASAIISGGTAGYNYQWLPGGSTSTSVSNLVPNSYTVKVTDAHNCLQTAPFTITQPAVLSVSVSATPAACFGTSTGSVSGVAAGGTAPYNYNWMPGNSNGASISNLPINTYTVTVTDSKGCSITNNATVTQPTAIVLVTDSTNSNCGAANGQASVIASGGAGSYVYNWLPTGGTNATATALLANIYSVSVTDGNNCVASKNVQVNNNGNPTVIVSSITNISCYGSSDGTATAAVTGGLGPYSYFWLPSGGTDSVAVGLSPGTYTVTVTDVHACQSNSAVSPVITQPSPILISLTTTNVDCFGNGNGAASAIILGGTAGYSYQWLPGGTTSTSVSNLSPNTYTVQVTDAHNCLQTAPFTITQPAVLSVSVSATPAACFGTSTGSVSGVAAGGTAPYNYNWIPGNSNGASISNLPINTYTVTVTDSKGCSITNNATVTQPTAIVLVTDSTNSNCGAANGQASVIASGGAGSYVYNWLPTGGTNATATALLANIYSVSVTDGNNCIAQATIKVNDNGIPAVTVSSSTNVTCYGNSNGTATALVTGGLGPYTYSWLPSGGTGSTATGLSSGNYTVTVTDSHACQSPSAVSPLITEPSPILITLTKNNVDCFGNNNGTVSAVISGGTVGYNYLWLPLGTTGTSISNLSPNTYTVQITDANNCVNSKTVTITEPTQLTSVILSTTDVSCFGGTNGTSTIQASGGVRGYNYNWLPYGSNDSTAANLSANTYMVTVTDFNGCASTSSAIINQPSQPLSVTGKGLSVSCFGGTNGTAGIHAVGGTSGYTYQWTPTVSVSDTAFGLASGNYVVAVTDSKQCAANVSVSISQPVAVSGSLASVNPSCALSNGSITSQVTGGVSPYAYFWTPNSSTTSSITAIGAGTYNLQVKDSLNCTLLLSATLTHTPLPAASISSFTNVSCSGGNDGTATVSVTQGTPPYTVQWLPFGGNNLTGSVLSIGTYTVTVTDDIGCQTTDSAVISEPLPMNITLASTDNVLCNGGNTGDATISVNGGTPLYSYSWLPAGANAATVNNLAAGTYTVNVSDQNNCAKAISISITEPPAFSSIIDSIVNPICYNGFGLASALASGGTIPYNYLWLPSGEAGRSVHNIAAGNYTVIVTDFNGCITSKSVLLTQPSQVITSAQPHDTLCLGQSGTITATASGGAGNYHYVWQPSGALNSGTLFINPTTNSDYSVVAFDQIGCEGTPDTTKVTMYNLTAANISVNAASPICPGQSSVVFASSTGNTGPLTYHWNNNLGTGAGVFVVTPTAPTMYIVTATNACGSSVSDTAKVIFSPPPIINITSNPHVLCTPGTVQFLDNSISATGDDPIASWSWVFGDGTSSSQQYPSHEYDLAGTYHVSLTITTLGGCTSNDTTAPLIIIANPKPVAAFSLNSSELNLPYDELILTNESVGAVSYDWSFGDGGNSTLVNPQYLYSSLGVFQVQLVAISQNGCSDTTTLEITANADVVFPNAFTPDLYGVPSGGLYDINSLDNNVFFPYTKGVVEYKLEIFDRWGEELFKSEDVKIGWDGYYKGKLCQQDVYVWRAYVKLNNGKVFKKTGDVTLLPR